MLLRNRLISTAAYFFEAPGGAGGGGAGGDAGSAGVGAGAGAGTGSGSGAGAAADRGAGAGAGSAVGDRPWYGEDWRERLAGSDAKKLDQLKRYADPSAFASAHFGLTDRIARGELKAPAKPLAADATAEQKTEWRKEQGLPE